MMNAWIFGFIGASLGGLSAFWIASLVYAGQSKHAESENKALHAKAEDLNTKLLDALQEKARLEAQKAEIDKQIDEFKQWKEVQQNEIMAQFETLSQKTLKTVKAELEEKHAKDAKRQKEALDTDIQKLLKPLETLIKENDEKVKHFTESSLKQTTELATQIKIASEQTQALVTAKNSLVDALKESKGRGDWGELELIRLLEDSGLQRGTHYEFQATQSNATRPDIKIKLPNNNVLYIDAKTLLVNLEKIQSALDENDIVEERKRLTQALKKEILKLQSKEYQTEGSTVDFVILYVPRESMLRIPLEEDPTLIQQAADRNIILASPLILMAILRTVAQGWHQAHLAEHSRAIEEMGKELHKRAANFLERYEKIGRKIQELQGQYEDTTTAFSGNQGFIKQMKKFEDYGCKSVKSLPSRYELIDTEEPAMLPMLDAPLDRTVSPVLQ
jgi:DNA recombination protein RmuC